MKALLLLLIVVLGALVVGEWRYWPARPPVYTGSVSGEAANTGQKQRLDAADGFHLPPFDDFDEVIQRPLFFEERRPPAPTPATEPDSNQRVKKRLKPPVGLAAIIIIDNERYALVRNKKDKTGTRRLRAGDSYEGWVVNEIKPDRLILRQGKQNEQILLRKFKKVPLPRAAPKRSVPTAAPKRSAKKLAPQRKRRPAPPLRRPKMKTTQ